MATTFLIATNLMNIAAETIGPKVQVTESHSYIQEDQISIELNYIHLNKNGSIFHGIQEFAFESGIHFNDEKINVSYIDAGVVDIELNINNTSMIERDEALCVTLDDRIPKGSIVIPELFSFMQLRKYFYIYDSFTATSDGKIILYIDRYKSVIEGLSKKPKIKLRVFKPVISN